MERVSVSSATEGVLEMGLPCLAKGRPFPRRGPFGGRELTDDSRGSMNECFDSGRRGGVDLKGG